MARNFLTPALILTLLVGTAMLPGAEAAVGVDHSRIDLGKLDPGTTHTRTLTVSNHRTETTLVQVQVACDCRDHLEVTPDLFRLPASSEQEVEIRIAIAPDADPGIHDHEILFIHKVETTSAGGTAESAVSTRLMFDVRTARMYLAYGAPPTVTYDLATDGTLGYRFVNGFADELEVRLSGTVRTAGTERTLEPVAFEARAGGARSAVTTGRIATGITADAAPGVYEIAMTATWTDPRSGAVLSQTETAVFGVGAAVTLADAVAWQTGNTVTVTGTLRNVGHVPVEARMGVNGAPAMTARSDAIDLAVGESRPVRVVVEALPHGSALSAFALFRSVDGETPDYAEGPHATVSWRTPGAEEANGTAKQTPGSSQELPALGIMALGLTAATALVVAIRRRRHG